MGKQCTFHFLHLLTNIYLHSFMTNMPFSTNFTYICRIFVHLIFFNPFSGFFFRLKFFLWFPLTIFSTIMFSFYDMLIAIRSYILLDRLNLNNIFSMEFYYESLDTNLILHLSIHHYIFQ